jgi:hypothetical protein
MARTERSLSRGKIMPTQNPSTRRVPSLDSRMALAPADLSPSHTEPLLEDSGLFGNYMAGNSDVVNNSYVIFA